MKKVLAVLAVAVAVCVSSTAMAATFDSNATGSFDTYRGPSGGLVNDMTSGANGYPIKLNNANAPEQQIGFASWYGDTALQSWVTAHPGATATMYIAVTSTMTAGKYAVETLRAGNAGALGSDLGNYPQATGASDGTAFRLGTVLEPVDGTTIGSGLGTVTVPDGAAWLTPAGRTGGSFGITAPNMPIQYNGSAIGMTPDTLYGYENAVKGMWAIGDLLGMRNGNMKNTTLANIALAGQIVNGGATASLWGAGNVVALNSKGQAAPAGFKWLAVPLDAAIVADVALNTQNKALVFPNNIVGCVTPANTMYFDGSAGNAPYLDVTPEPATMVLLAMGGLALVRRRHA